MNNISEVETHETSHRERDDNYHSIVYQKGKYRVILAAQKNQWIFQVRRDLSGGRSRWVSKSYPTTKEAVLRTGHAYFGAPTPIELLELPERVSGVRK